MAVEIPIPHILVGTRIGELLMERMIHSEWVDPPWENIPEEWKQVLQEGCSDAELRDAQLRLGIKRTAHVIDPVCAWCQTAMGHQYRKCAVCLTARYCSDSCQKKHWPSHRQVCLAPNPRISGYVVVCLPDYLCFRQYIDWASKRKTPGTVGFMLMNRTVFDEEHSVEASKRSILSLAIRGHPDLVMASVKGSTAQALAPPRQEDPDTTKGPRDA